MSAPLSEHLRTAMGAALTHCKPATDEEVRSALSDALSVGGHHHQPLISERLNRAERHVPAIVRRLLDTEAEVARLGRVAQSTDREMDQVIGERDRASDAADALSERVAPIEVIGEHTGDNDPWANARELVTPYAEVEKLRARVAELEQQLAVAQAPRVRPMPRPMRFDGVPDAVLVAALRSFVATHLDYDMHKNLEEPEDGRPDQYPELARELAKGMALQAEAAGFEVEPWGGDR